MVNKAIRVARARAPVRLAIDTLHVRIRIHIRVYSARICHARACGFKHARACGSDVRPEVGRGQKCLRICPIASAGPASSCKRMSFRRLYQM